MEGNFERKDLEEIEKLKDVLMPDEKVLFIGRQSRLRPGGSLTTPNTIFATDQRVLIRNPSALGLRAAVEDYPYSAITGVRIKKGMFSSKVYIVVPGSRGGFLGWKKDSAELAALPKDRANLLNRIIREGIARVREKPAAATAVSPLDEIKKLAELKEAGLITEEEFQAKKKKLLEKI